MKRSVVELSVEEIEALLDAIGAPGQDSEELANARAKLNAVLEMMNK
ncbi:MAG: hypothetical protein KatS3mg087_1924 [Patescibacteria group bacterium]|nr:MAG: hypothetical protein KatS3mg087_1924 [Patescibacteria group bacterium]